MFVQTRCPSCLAEFRVVAESVGKKAKCKHCGERFTVACEEDLSVPDDETAVGDPTAAPDESEVDDYDAPSRPPVNLDDWLASGREYLADRRYDEAERIFQRLAEDYPGVESVRLGLRDCLKARFASYRLLAALGLRRAVAGSLDAQEGQGKMLWLIGCAAAALVKIVKDHREFGAVIGPIALGLFGAWTFVQLLDHVATLRVRRFERGWMAVNRLDIAVALTASALMLLAWLFIAVHQGWPHTGWLMLTMTCFLLLGPAWRLSRVPQGKPLVLAISYLALLAGLGIAATVSIFTYSKGGGDWDERLPRSTAVPFIAFVLGVVFNGFFARLFSTLESDGMAERIRGFAERPGNIRLCERKLRRFHPHLFGIRGFLMAFFSGGDDAKPRHIIERARQNLHFGDSQPAVVASLQPLLVAAYSDEFDAVVMLKFNDGLAVEHGLTRGSRLLSINTYLEDPKLGRDIDPGPAASKRYSTFWPTIADFITDDLDIVKKKKADIPAELWDRANELAAHLLRRPILRPRNGAPLFSIDPPGDE